MDKIATTEKGKLFENEVKEVLRLHGKNVSGEKLIGHKKVDLSFTEISFSKTYHYAVECKDYDFKLQKKDVIDICSDYSALFDSNLIDTLLIVTRHGLGATSEEFLQLKKNVEHITYNDLLNNTIDFSNYINFLISEFESSPDGLSQYYINTKVKENTVTKKPSKDLDEIIDLWIESDNYSPIAILGSYGQGKTSFSKHLSFRLSRNFLANNSTRIPLYIKLSYISKEQSIEGLLGKIFTSTVLVRNYNYHSFSQLNKLGKFVIILDGFDEMKHSLNWEEFKYNFSQLNKLVVNNSKVILLGRPNAFLTDDEHLYVLKGLKNTNLGEIKDHSWPEYSELEISPLDSNQIRKFLENYYSYRILKERDYKKQQKLIHARDYKAKSISDKRIREISSRPVQLKMLADLLPFTSMSIESITTSYLYSEFIDLILDREYEKEAKVNISKEDRRRFSSLIAIFLWENSNEYSIKYEDIPDEIFQQFIPRNSKEIDKIKRDLISGCFLERKIGSSIYFPHRSFQEFLIADEIINQIQSKSLDLTRINEIITNEISDFLVGLSGLKTLANFHEVLKDHTGIISLKILRIFIKPENKNFVFEKLLTSYSPWYFFIFVLLHKKYQYTKEEVENFRNKVLDYIQISDSQKLYFGFFLSLHSYIRSSKDCLLKLCNLAEVELERINKQKRSSSLKKEDYLILNRFSDFFLRINLSSRNASIDFRGLSQPILKHLQSWCFVSEWIKEKIIDTGEYPMDFQTEITHASTLTMINDVKNNINSLLEVYKAKLK